MLQNSTSGGYKIRNQYGLHFVTFTAVGWVDIFSRRKCKDIIISALEYCKIHKGLRVWAYVIMESHVHLILSAQESSSGLSSIIRDYKKHTSKEIIKWASYNKKESRRDWMLIVFKYHAKYNKRNAKYQVWKQDNRPMELIHPRFTCQKLEYIHNNPVKSGIVDKAEEFRYSSARNYLGRKDFILKVDLIDFGCDVGYLPIG